MNTKTNRTGSLASPGLLFMRRLGPVVLLALLLSLSNLVAQISVTSTFDTNTDGWIVEGLAGGPTYVSTGGNPGGYIYGEDAGSDDWYFKAPTKFLANQSATYGGSLSFDLRQYYTSSQYDTEDIIIEGGGLRIVFDTPNNPGTSWTHYQIPLTETAGWKKTSLSGVAPTAAEIKAVLASITRLLIRGEYQNGTDKCDLDNVILTSTSATQNASLAPVVGGYVQAGVPFWVEVRVGDPNAVTGLYGLALKLQSDNAACTYVDGSATAGSFLGSSPLTIYRKVDAQTVDMGVTKSAAPGVSGSGTVVKAQFISAVAGSIGFSFKDVVAVDQNGVTIPLSLSGLTVVVNSGAVTLPTLMPVGVGPFKTGSSFWVEVRVGDPNAVAGLYGISFKLRSDKGTCTYVDGSATAGTFLGSSPLTFFQKADAQTVDIGVTRSAAPGVSGSGTVARAQFTSSAVGIVGFSFADVVAVDQNGTTIPLAISGITVSVTTGAVLTPTLRLLGSSPFQTGSAFSVEVRVGDPNAVTGLYGIAFKLKSDKATCTYVDGSSTAGTFLGTSPLTFFRMFDQQTVDIGITKSTSPGVSGTGTVVRAQFVSSAAGVVQFSLFDVTAVDQNGAPIALDLQGLTVTVTGSTTVAPETWIWQNGLPTSNDLYSVKFLNPSIGWALGDGTILRTTNGGTTWTRVRAPSPGLIYAFTSVDANTGWAVGGAPTYYPSDAGTILKTTDGGISWTKQSSGTSNALYAVTFLNASTGWAVGAGGTMLKTTNGGASWSSQSSGTTSDLKSAFFLDANTGWIVGNGGMALKTTNGGSTWSSLSSGTTKDLRSVTFTDANTGWAVGGDYYWSGSTAINTSLILKTTNGGSSWSVQSTGSSFALYGVSFTDANNGWAVGGYVNWPNDYPMTYGAIQRTTNGGASWTTPVNGVVSYLRSVAFTDANTGWAVGNAGTILKTTNGGTTWSQQLATVTRDLLFAVSFVDAYNGWVCGTNKDNAGVLRTTNGGASWTAMPAISTNPSLNSMDFIDVNTGWTVGWPGLIYKTINGGQSWTSQTSGTNSVLRGVNFVDANTGWAVGNVGAIMKTSNGGSTWVNQGGGSAYYWCVFALNSSSAWVGGDNFSILKTTNGGTNWTTSYSIAGSADLVRAIAFYDANTGWGVGDGGRIVKTTNGGSTWTIQTSGTTSGLYAVAFTSASTGWAAGQSGMLLKTNDGGATWNRQILPTYQDLFGMAFISPNTGWIVGGNGTILSTTIGNLTAIEKRDGFVPATFALEQNYPNPFNPSTTIRYTLPQNSSVKIAVFNTLGQRIADIVDANQSAGSYSVVWNASVSSGIYFYRLEAIGTNGLNQRFVDVKKMVVLK